MAIFDYLYYPRDWRTKSGSFHCKPHFGHMKSDLLQCKDRIIPDRVSRIWPYMLQRFLACDHDLKLWHFSVIVILGLWILRFWLDQSGASKDAAVILFIAFLFHGNSLFISLITLYPFSCLTVITFVVIVCIYWLFHILQHSAAGGPSSKQTLSEKSPLSPMILPCRTNHTRLFPVKHSFSYSYFYVGIPIGWKGPAGTLLSADSSVRDVRSPSRAKTWYSVEAEDYLERGSDSNGLQGKLNNYLRNLGVGADIYPHAFLVTAPRFLGLCFNPVSFWYLYNKEHELRAMILEVNNTFDERRMYFMAQDSTELQDSCSENFEHHWDKDFHVSPFNPRDGSYSLKAINPFPSRKAKEVVIDCNIVLKSPEGKPKMVARVFSTCPALDATTITRWQAWNILIRWWWVGLMTNPRILREARILWVKRLQVFYRPEVMPSSIGRQERREEAVLEEHFRLLLIHMAKDYGEDLRLSYIAAAGPKRGQKELLVNYTRVHSPCDRVEIIIRTLSPAFYSQFVRRRTMMQAFDELCFDATSETQLLHVSNQNCLKQVVSSFNQSICPKRKPTWLWYLVSILRSSDALGALLAALHNMVSNDDAPHGTGSISLSQMDWHIICNDEPDTATTYSRALLLVLLSDRMAFGFVPLLRAYFTFFWTAMVYLTYTMLKNTFTLELVNAASSTWGPVLSVFALHLTSILGDGFSI